MLKTENRSPKLTLAPAYEELQIPVGTPTMGQNVGGLSMFQNSLKRGYGDQTWGVDENGFWLGAADYADAPFRIDYQGRMYFSAVDDDDNQLVIDAVNLRIVLYIAGVPQALWGYQLNGF